MDRFDQVSAITAPSRRAVSHMRALIRSHNPGDEWTVQIRSPIFGVYCVFGPVHRSTTTGELRIGLALLTSGGTAPSNRVLEIWPGPTIQDDFDGEPCAAAEVNHGELVRATVAPFGESLTLVGHAVGQQRNGLIGVGHHTIMTPEGASPSLRSLSRYLKAMTEPPPKLYSWADADEIAPR